MCGVNKFLSTKIRSILSNIVIKHSIKAFTLKVHSSLASGGTTSRPLLHFTLPIETLTKNPGYPLNTYIHTYIHTYIRTYIRTYIHTYTHTYIHTYIRAHTHIRTHTYVHTHTHAHTHARTHTQTHTYIYTYIPDR